MIVFFVFISILLSQKAASRSQNFPWFLGQSDKSSIFSAKLIKESMSLEDIEKKIKECEKEMKKAAKEFRFEDAAHFRDLLRYYQSLEIIG